MHDCLLIPEIVQHICDQVDDIQPASRNAQLFALAQTCRVFQEPALATLWRAIPSIVPILRCVGSNILEVSYQDASGETMRLCRPISPSDVVVMKKYARLVRHFGIPITPSVPPPAANTSHLDPSVWDMLRSAVGDTALFTNIQTFIVSDVHTMELVPLFNTENLTSFGVFRVSSHTLRERWLSTVETFVDFPARYSGFAYVYSQPHGFRNTLHMTDTALPKLPNLSRFSSSYGALEVLKALRHVSNSLQCLRLGLFILAPRGFQVLKPEHLPPFRALKELCIGFNNATDAIQLINYLPSVNTLEILSISFKNSGLLPEIHWLRLLQAIRKHSHCLRALEIIDKPRGLVPLSKIVFLTLQTDFTALTHVNFVNRGGHDIVDEDLKQMTEAMPWLKEFCLPDNADRCQVTIASFLHFARNCPSLSRLELTLDARAEKIPPRAEPSIRGVNVKKVHIWNSLVDDPWPVAVFLNTIFPKLQYILAISGEKALEIWNHLVILQGQMQ